VLRQAALEKLAELPVRVRVRRRERVEDDRVRRVPRLVVRLAVRLPARASARTRAPPTWAAHTSTGPACAPPCSGTRAPPTRPSPRPTSSRRRTQGVDEHTRAPRRAARSTRWCARARVRERRAGGAPRTGAGGASRLGPRIGGCRSARDKTTRTRWRRRRGRTRPRRAGTRRAWSSARRRRRFVGGRTAPYERIK
jgi:hypothetical protein